MIFLNQIEPLHLFKGEPLTEFAFASVILNLMLDLVVSFAG
jgi:hypothetical protein